MGAPLASPNVPIGTNGWRAVARDLMLLAAAGGLIYTGIEWGSARQSLIATERSINEHVEATQVMAEENGHMKSRIAVLESRVAELERRLEKHEQGRP